MFGGVGGCKEEVHGLSASFADRGIAVLAVDLPGLGESLLVHHYRWRLDTVTRAMDNSIEYLKTRDEVQPDKIGVYGLCLGGGMAYKYTALHPENVAYLATMFPMLLNPEAIANTPPWMKTSEWFSFFSGDAPNQIFEQEMSVGDDLIVQCPYLLIHGRHDNWTPLERAMELYQQAIGKKDVLVIEEEAVHESGHATTHTIPVADQFHWAMPVTADRFKALIGD